MGIIEQSNLFIAMHRPQAQEVLKVVTHLIDADRLFSGLRHNQNQVRVRTGCN
jgi:hypothetical protein